MFSYFYNLTTAEAEAEALAWARTNGCESTYTLDCLGASPDGSGTWLVCDKPNEE